jgi:ABC-type antimicrobial peptide transport system permease subunit
MRRAIWLFLTHLGRTFFEATKGSIINVLPAALLGVGVVAVSKRLRWSTNRRYKFLTAHLVLLLAAIGLYGVMSYAVSQSTRELWLRMAVGARPLDLFRLVMLRGLVMTAGGIVLGAVAALGLTRLIGDLLYKVNPRDPFAFGSAFLVMAIVSLAACFLPAWRATRIDPIRALRD